MRIERGAKVNHKVRIYLLTSELSRTNFCQSSCNMQRANYMYYIAIHKLNIELNVLIINSRALCDSDSE